MGFDVKVILERVDFFGRFGRVSGYPQSARSGEHGDDSASKDDDEEEELSDDNEDCSVEEDCRNEYA